MAAEAQCKGLRQCAEARPVSAESAAPFAPSSGPFTWKTGSFACSLDQGTAVPVPKSFLLHLSLVLNLQSLLSLFLLVHDFEHSDTHSWRPCLSLQIGEGKAVPFSVGVSGLVAEQIEGGEGRGGEQGHYAHRPAAEGQR